MYLSNNKTKVTKKHQPKQYEYRSTQNNIMHKYMSINL